MRENTRRSPRGTHTHTTAVFPAGRLARTRGRTEEEEEEEVTTAQDLFKRHRQPSQTYKVPFQGTHGRSSGGGGAAADLKALPRLVEKQGQARRHVFPRAAPVQPARRRVPRGAAGVEQAGGKTFLFPSIWII